MKPDTDIKCIRKAKYKYKRYKELVKSLRNKKKKDFRNDKNIHLT